mmetsp:Transcript_4152/g.12172  ORF Transcript_4152/g.12172 Transcript_4152/m.12172 type:complete len:234 (-) Transcript_4152:512-1213(-)
MARPRGGGFIPYSRTDRAWTVSAPCKRHVTTTPTESCCNLYKNNLGRRSGARSAAAHVRPPAPQVRSSCAVSTAGPRASHVHTYMHAHGTKNSYGASGWRAAQRAAGAGCSQLLLLVVVAVALQVEQCGLDLLRVLWREVERAREVHHRLLRPAELLVQLAHRQVDHALLWRDLDQQLQLGERRLALVHREQHLRLLEAGEGVARVDLDCLAQLLERLRVLPRPVQRHAEVAV